MTYAPLFLHEKPWTIVFWLSFVALVCQEIWVFWRDRRKVKGETHDRGSLQAILLLQNIGFLACFAIPYLTDRGTIRMAEPVLFWTAIVVLWLGWLLRNWAVRTLGRFFRTTVVVQDDHQLVTSGPYRFLRNPSYSGALLMFMGVGLAQGNAFSVIAIFGTGLLSYGARILAEEAALRSRFGADYDAYRKRSWALIPPIW